MKSARRMSSEAVSRSQIMLGGGSRTGGTFAPRTIPSHRTRSVTPNRVGTKTRTAGDAG